MSANIKHESKLAPSSAMFKTVGGDVTSIGSTVVQFHFPKLNPTSTITHRFEVINDSQDEMVIGRDIMDSLGIVLNFKDKVVQWDGHRFARTLVIVIFQTSTRRSLMTVSILPTWRPITCRHRSPLAS